MSCEKCDEVQDDVSQSFFMRITRANVMILACEEHFKEVQRLIKAGMAAESAE